jgi:hypothetical protein
VKLAVRFITAILHGRMAQLYLLLLLPSISAQISSQQMSQLYPSTHVAAASFVFCHLVSSGVWRWGWMVWGKLAVDTRKGSNSEWALARQAVVGRRASPTNKERALSPEATPDFCLDRLTMALPVPHWWFQLNSFIQSFLLCSMVMSNAAREHTELSYILRIISSAQQGCTVFEGATFWSQLYPLSSRLSNQGSPCELTRTFIKILVFQTKLGRVRRDPYFHIDTQVLIQSTVASVEPLHLSAKNFF